MENTDSDILGLRLTSSLMWISNRGHVFRIGGIILHRTGVFLNVLMLKKRHESRTTSDLSKSDCSVHGKYRQRYIRVRDNFENSHSQKSQWRPAQDMEEQGTTNPTEEKTRLINDLADNELRFRDMDLPKVSTKHDQSL